jgi:anti-sigma regulatory factor (Ser/Thr protein kinase)
LNTQNKQDKLTIEAAVENLEAVQAFVDERLEAVGCSMKAQMQIDVAVEEIFVNIASYAYAPGTGDAVVCVELSEDGTVVTISFIDHGKAYDPLSRDDPDISLPAEERDVGGLGILMTKKLMDELSYSYRDGQNILTMKKRI